MSIPVPPAPNVPMQGPDGRPSPEWDKYFNTINALLNNATGAVVPVNGGGTGQTSYTNGQLLIGNTTGNTLEKATLTAGTDIEITNGNGAVTIGVNIASGLSSSNGGTGQTTYTDGQLLIGKTAGNTLAKNTLTAGSGIGIANGSGAITISNTGVTSNVAGTNISVNSATGASTIGLTGIVATANGGTGQSTYTDGQLLIGRTDTGQLNKATLTAAAGIQITNGAGFIQIASTVNGISISYQSFGVAGSPHTYTPSANTQFFIVEGWGGGGSGAGPSDANDGVTFGAGGGGGGGGYFRVQHGMSGFTTGTIVIGAGGASPFWDSNGNNGGDTTFTDTGGNVWTAKGGNGGNKGAALATNTPGVMSAAGGTSNAPPAFTLGGSEICVRGAPGEDGIAVNLSTTAIGYVRGGSGGGTFGYFPPPGQIIVTTGGVNGMLGNQGSTCNHGVGGCGGSQWKTDNTYFGGAGADGFVLITEYKFS